MDLKRNDYQRNSTWNTPYTFSGKEKDIETGYGYVKKLRFFSSLAFGNEKQVFHYAHCLRRFGARYYDSGLSIWLSVDPMSDKYPSMSPYNYCANNPVILVDPDGRWIKGAGLLRNIFRSDAYCVSYLAATSRGLPLSSIEKVGKNHYNVSWMSNDGYSIYDENGLTSRISLPTFNIMSIKIKNTLFKFNLSGVAFYNNSSRDRPGPDRKTNQDVNMVDISNFPTGTGATNGKSIFEAFKFGTEVVEKTYNLYDLFIDHQEKIKNDAWESRKNDTIHVPDLPGSKPHWYDKRDDVPLWDSLRRAQEKISEREKN